MRIAALGGIAGPILFSMITIVSAALRPDYSHVRNFISELGANGTRHAALMNYAGFVPAGLMLAAFGITLAAALPRDSFRIVASILVTLFGAGVAADGIIACDPGCPQSEGSVENLIHNRIAPVAFLCAITGAGIVGVRFRRLLAWRNLSRYSLMTSAVALCFLVALATSLESRLLTGLWQRLLLVTLFSWCAVVSLRVSSSQFALSNSALQPTPQERRG
jgi:hypothetical membrane protein